MLGVVEPPLTEIRPGFVVPEDFEFLALRVGGGAGKPYA